MDVQEVRPTGARQELLRPMGIGDILDTTFWLYRRRFLTFLMIALIVYIPYALLAGVFQASMPDPSQTGRATQRTEVRMGGDRMNVNRSAPGRAQMPEFNLTGIFVGLGAMLIFAVILMPLCSAALTQNISASYLGQNLSAAESYGRAAPRLPGLIWTQILAGLAIFAGFLLLIVPGIIFSFWFALVSPVVVLESVSGSAALGRSRELIRGNIGKAFLLGIVVGILTIIISLVLGWVVGMIPWPHPILRHFFANVVAAFVLPIQTAPLILLYYDLRIRKEAFDLQKLSEALGQPSAT